MQVDKFPIHKIPKYVIDIGKRLKENNFQAFIVGGGIRDLFIGRVPKDFDIATDAVPEEITDIFPKSIATGAKFGNIIVVAEDEHNERFDVDVTTFREEEDYHKGRWPSKVEFTKRIKGDLSRRDFTINALAINIELIIDNDDEFLDLNEVVDEFGGLDDLREEKIKCVGNPVERFKEDGLRPFRACRLASELNFSIEKNTKAAIEETLDVAKLVSKERIRDEIKKIIKHSPKPSIGFKLMDETGLLNLVLPELTENKNITQPEWHEDDSFEHSLKCMDIAEDSIKLAALFHDIGKARTRSEDENGIHFYNHNIIGAHMVKEIMTRLKFSKKETERISNLVRWHMFYYPSAEWRQEYDIEEADKVHRSQEQVKHGWTDAAVRRFIRKVGGQEQLDDLIKLRIADAGCNPRAEFDPIEIRILEKRIAEVRKKDMALKITDLDINGNDLMKIGVKPGPQMGKILETLLEKVIEDPTLNNKEKLLEIVWREFK